MLQLFGLMLPQEIYPKIADRHPLLPLLYLQAQHDHIFTLKVAHISNFMLLCPLKAQARIAHRTDGVFCFKSMIWRQHLQPFVMTE